MSKDDAVPRAFIRELGRRVFAASALADGDLWRAADKVWRQLSVSEQYSIALFGLIEAESLAFRTQHPNGNGGDGGQWEGDTQGLAAPFSRRRTALAGADPLTYIVAIGNTGTRKSVGELTREDLTAIADYFGMNKRAYAAKESGYRTIAAKIPLGKTVAEAQKRLSAKDREFLLSDLGISAVGPETVAPAKAAAA